MTTFQHVPPLRQRGATLVIAMIMLILATLFVLAAINMSSTNLLVIGNQQARNEAIEAAQQVVEQVASRDFTKAPANVPEVVTPVTVDVNGGGRTGYTVTVPPPKCLNAVPVKLSDLKITSANDFPCFGSGQSAQAGVPGGTGNGDSYCSATAWDISATAADTADSTGTTVTLHQGVSKRIATGDSPC